jgi:hypothetical protein
MSSQVGNFYAEFTKLGVGTVAAPMKIRKLRPRELKQ